MTHDKQVKPTASAMERAAKREKQRIEAEQAMQERRQAEAAFRANYERLKAERLARDRELVE